MSLSTPSQHRSIERINTDILAAARLDLEHAVTLPAAAYTSEDYFAWECEHVFSQEWICVAHVSQVAEPGDYLSVDFLDEPLLVVRGKDDVVRVLSRVCPHRAMDILPAGFGRDARGNTTLFTCPYHSWTFELGGELRGAPGMEQTCNFDRASTRLPEFRSEIWEGFVFVTFNAEAQPVAERLADLQRDVGAWRMGDMSIAVEMEWDMAVNWKNMIENWMEPYHHMGIHAKTLQPLMPARGCWTEDDHPHYTRAHLPYRPSLTESLRREKAGEAPLSSFPPIPGVPAELENEWTVHVGFPVFLLLTGPNCAIWYRLLPLSAERLHLVTTILVHDEARAHPDFAKHLESESGLLRAFHLEDVEVCTAVQRGLHSRAFRPGRMSHLEKPVHQIQRYLAARIEAARGREVANECAA